MIFIGLNPLFRILIPLLLALSACAPTNVVIPKDAPTVTTVTGPPLQARVAINFKALSDGVVGEQYKIYKQRGVERFRRKATVYHVAPASRSMLTNSLQKVFKDVEVVTGKVKRGAFDIIIFPRIQFFLLYKTDELFRDAEADIGYDLTFFDGRGGKIGDRQFDGDGNSGESSRDDLPRVTRAIVHAMENASRAIITELPGDDLMKPWRRQ